MGECIFCKISAGSESANFIYEDDHCVVVNDINPRAATHLLIISKQHIDSIATMEEKDETLVGRMIYVGKLMADRLGLKGYKLTFNVGKDGGQEIFHIHLHLMSNQSS